MRVNIVIDNRVRLLLDSVPTELQRQLRAKFEHENVQREAMRRMGIPVWGEPKRFDTWREEVWDGQRWLSLPRGGMGRLREVLEEGGVGVHVQDLRERGTGPRGIPDHRVELHPHQRQIVEAIVSREQGIVRSGTGSGKTTALIGAIARLKVPSLVVVPSKAILKLWQVRVARELGVELEDQGIVQGTKTRLAPVTVGIWMSVANRAAEDKEFRRYFGAVMLDECFASGTPVLMADGTLRRIENVDIGDEVAVGGRVLSKSRRKYEGRAVEVNGHLATPEHPLAVPGRGWVRSSIVGGSDLLYDPQHELRSLREEASGAEPKGALSEAWRGWDRQCDSSVFALWEGDSGKERRLPRKFSMWDVGPGEQGSDWCSAGLEQGVEEPYSLSSFFQSLEGSGVEEQDKVSSFQGAALTFQESRGAGREQAKVEGPYREWDHQTFWRKGTWERGVVHFVREGDVQAAVPARVRTGVCSHHGETSAPLQDRSCSPDEEGRGGVGWGEPQLDSEAEDGRAEDALPRVEWVEGYPLPCFRQDGVPVRLRRGSPRVREGGLLVACRVYNLETENGVYVAAGVLVHNCHMAGASSFFRAIDPMPARYRIGTSDDHRRKDRKEFLVFDVFGEVIESISRASLIADKRVLDVEVRVVPTGFRADWYGLPDGAGRWGGRELDFQRLCNEMMADEVRRELIVGCVMEEFRAGKQSIVMCHEREHCMSFVRMLSERNVPVGFLFGGADYSAEFDSTLAGLNSGRIRVGVGTYRAAGTGIDMPSLGAVFAATPIAGNEQFFSQVRGRACRVAEGKEGACLYYFADTHVYGEHVRNIVKWNAQVVVREGGEWVPAKSWLKRAGAASREAQLQLKGDR